MSAYIGENSPLRATTAQAAPANRILTKTTAASRSRLRLVLLTTLVGVVAWVIVDYSAGFHVIKHGLDEFLHWLTEHPLSGCAAFAGVYSITTVLCIPGAALTLACALALGHAFGAGKGVVLCSISVFIGASLGATLAFLLGRYLLRADAERLLSRSIILRSVDIALQRDGLKVMTLLRLSPVVPFTALNYVSSLTSVTLRDYVLALFGMIPGTLAYSWLGAAAGEVSAGKQQTHQAKIIRIVVYVVGGVALLAAVAMISSYAKKELDRAGVAPDSEHLSESADVQDSKCGIEVDETGVESRC